MAAHHRAEDLIAIGAYVPGSDPRVDEARAKHHRIEAFLRQTVDEPYDRAQTMAAMIDIAGAGPAPVAVDEPALPAVTGELVADGQGFTGVFDPLPPGAEVV